MKCTGSFCIFFFCTITKSPLKSNYNVFILHFTHAADVGRTKRQCNKLHLFFVFFFFFFLKNNVNANDCHFVATKILFCAIGLLLGCFTNVVVCVWNFARQANELLILTEGFVEKFKKNYTESVLIRQGDEIHTVCATAWKWCTNAPIELDSEQCAFVLCVFVCVCTL